MKTGLALLAICGALLSECPAQEQTKSSTPSASPTAQTPVIIPQPKCLRPGSGQFRLRSNDKWVLRAAARDERLWLAAQSVLSTNSGSFNKSSQPWVSLEVGSPAADWFPGQLVSASVGC